MTATETPVERPVEFVQSLPDEQKRSVLFALLREFYAVNGDLAAIPLREGDTDLGYLVRPNSPEAARHEHLRQMRLVPPSVDYDDMVRQMPPELAAAIEKPVPENLDWDDVVSRDELRKIRQEVLSRTAR